jgi:hypothetical protein
MEMFVPFKLKDCLVMEIDFSEALSILTLKIDESQHTAPWCLYMRTGNFWKGEIFCSL